MPDLGMELLVRESGIWHNLVEHYVMDLWVVT
jgi:hypothetical protein